MCVCVCVCVCMCVRRLFTLERKARRKDTLVARAAAEAIFYSLIVVLQKEMPFLLFLDNFRPTFEVERLAAA